MIHAGRCPALYDGCFVVQVTEVLFSSGLRVSWKRTSFLADQVLLAAAAVGGLTQIPRKLFATAKVGAMLATTAGQLGYRPTVLSNILAGKLAWLEAGMDAYWRNVSGESSAHEVEELMQLLHLLFTSDLQPSKADEHMLLRTCRETIRAEVVGQNTAWYAPCPAFFGSFFR